MVCDTSIVAFDEVSRTFASPAGRVEVLHDITLRIRPGDFAALTGPSGSGKTTLLHLAGLLDEPSAGTIRFEGDDLAGATEPERCRRRGHRIGMVFQQFHLLPHRTVFENALFRFRYIPHDRRRAGQRVVQVLDRLGLGHVMHQRAAVLSGGEMQRLAIARAIAVPPALLIADEPTGNLDAENAASVMRCFRELNAEGLTVLMATHNHNLLTGCTRRFTCHDGRVREGST